MGLRSWIRNRWIQTAPAAPPSSSPGLFGGEVYADDASDGVAASSSSHFERYRTLIDTFDEERETALEKGVRYLLLVLAYLLPLVVAWAMGREIGDAYGGPFSWSDGWSLGTHVVAYAGEFALTMMTFSAATALRRMAADPGYVGKFFGSLVLFVLASLASGLAQWFIASQHVHLHDTPSLAALVFRVAMVPAVDIASLLFLAVMTFRSLKKFLADQRIRAQAIRDINEAELDIQRAQAAAARRETEERQDMHMKEARNEVWLELDRLHAQAMITDAKRRMLPLSTSVDELPQSAADAPGAEQVQIRRIDRRS
jgi:hypothetical protein